MQQKGDGNRKALNDIVRSGQVPGILAYAEHEPVGWCAVAPREVYAALERSRTLKRIDQKPVWSVVCFFVAKAFRGKGMTVKLLEAAIEHVRSQGGRVVEGYPLEKREERTPDPFVYMGLASAFRKAGFVEVLHKSKTRSIMRYTIKRD
jgi:GNAT superfamily N-acetyltransferase